MKKIIACAVLLSISSLHGMGGVPAAFLLTLLHHMQAVGYGVADRYSQASFKIALWGSNSNNRQSGT